MIEEINNLSTSQASTAGGHAGPNLSMSSTSNATSATMETSEDPINQLSAILGAHLRALNSIDGNAGKLESKVRELEVKAGSAGGEGRQVGFGRR